MTTTKKKRIWIATTLAGGFLSLLSLWQVWIFVPMEATSDWRGYIEMKSPDWEELIPASDPGHLDWKELIADSNTGNRIETGLRGAIDLGPLIPSWIFISLLTLTGLLSGLNIGNVLKIPVQVTFTLVAISMAPLTYWVVLALAKDCEPVEGYALALVGTGLILFPAIKNYQAQHKATQS